MSLLPYDVPGLRRLFETLEPLAIGDLRGVYERRYIGPLLARDLTPLGLKLTGMKKWWGSVYDGKGAGRCLVETGGEKRRSYPRVVSAQPSDQDGRPSIAIRFDSSAPMLWRKVIDEPRRLDATRLLALVSVDLPALTGKGWPMLLETRPDIDLASY